MASMIKNIKSKYIRNAFTSVMIKVILSGPKKFLTARSASAALICKVD